MRRWLGLATIAGMLGILTGCPAFGRMTMRFDLATGQGVVLVEDIGTDEPGAADQDFARIVNEYILGSTFQDDHPTWRVGERKLFESQGRLDGRVDFQFSRPSDVGLYQHDRKSPYFWCAEGGDTVVSTSGTIIPQYPNCVAFDRKAKQLEVTVTSGSMGPRTSLLPQFGRWNGEALEVTDPGMGDLGNMLGEAFRRAMEGQTDDLGGLGGLLPKVEASEDWKTLGLPLSGSQVIYQTERTYQANHTASDNAAVLATYTAALAPLGWVVVETGEDLVVWEREGTRITGTATRAGPNVIVSLSH